MHDPTKQTSTMEATLPGTRVPLGSIAPNVAHPPPPASTSSATAFVGGSDKHPPQAEKPVSKKRKAERPHYHIDDDICQTVTISCSAVRNKIKRFLDSGEMKVGEFMKEIGASSATYYNFMNKTGVMGGSGSTTYGNAFAFFKLRELNGIKITKKKKVEGGEVDASTKGASSTRSTNFEGIVLEGEEDDSVPVYDSCDEIRRKIRQFLNKTNMSQAAFAREIGKMFHPAKPTVSGLSAFLEKKGPVSGNTSAIFYGCYVFFEKMRIRNGNPKTEHRLGMEEAWGNGLDTVKFLDRVQYIVPIGGEVYMDEFGKAVSGRFV